MLTKEQTRALSRPFAETEIEWRVGQAGLTGDEKPWIRALAYLTSRAIMERLDEVFGVGGWSDSVREINLGEISTEKGKMIAVRGVVCTLRVRLTDGSWVEHEDVAECSDIEPLKGSASGALKRVAVKVGIGRYLYYLEDGFAVVTPNGRFRYYGEDKKTKKIINCRWNPPALPAWALPAPEDKPYNPYATIKGDAPEAPTEPEEGLAVPDGLPEVFVAGVRKILNGTDPAKKLAKQYSGAAEKARSLGADVPLVLAPNLSAIAIANEVMRVKSTILQLEMKAVA